MNPDNIISSADRILVTGSNGFIGTRVVENLLARGFTNLRLFVRPSSHLTKLKEILGKYPIGAQAEIISGDLLSREDCQAAARDVAVIIHLAAGFKKSFAEAFKNSAVATQNLLEAFSEFGRPKRFVSVSSFTVYSNLNMKRGALLDESCPLEESPEKRHDPYAYGKLKQEEIVRHLGRTHNIPFVILRPGTVFGPGKSDLTGRIGFNLRGLFLHVGGANQLPLTYIDNCADAIVLAGIRPNIEGETFNVVDDELLTSREFLRAYHQRRRHLFCLPLPYSAAYLLCALCEVGSKYFKRVPRSFNRRRCAAEWKGNRFSNQKLRSRLGWQPTVPMKQAMANFLSQF